MKKIFLILAVLFFATTVYSFLPTFVRAQSGDFATELDRQQGEVAGAAGMPAPVDPRSAIINIIRVLLTFVGTVVFVITVYAGFTWMTAGGDEEKITQATALLRNCVIGLAIILASYAITIAISYIAQGYRINYGTNDYQKIIVN